MLKILAEEGKVESKLEYVGKKKKEIFSITEIGIQEFKAWLQSPTNDETPRNEFLLKLFFVTNEKEMMVLIKERLGKAEKIYEEFKQIEKRLEESNKSPWQAIRLKALRYGIIQINAEIEWLKEEILCKL